MKHEPRMGSGDGLTAVSLFGIQSGAGVVAVSISE